MSRFRWQTREVSSRQTARHIEKNVSRSRYERTVGWAVSYSRRAQCPCFDSAVDALAEVLRYRRVQSLVAYVNGIWHNFCRPICYMAAHYINFVNRAYLVATRSFCEIIFIEQLCKTDKTITCYHYFSDRGPGLLRPMLNTGPVCDDSAAEGKSLCTFHAVYRWANSVNVPCSIQHHNSNFFRLGGVKNRPTHYHCEISANNEKKLWRWLAQARIDINDRIGSCH